MSCEHASTRTVLWAYGELDDEVHGRHVATCAACQEVLEQLELVEAAVAPVAGALATEPAAPSAPEPWAQPSAHAPRRRVPWGLVALAAVLVGTIVAALWAAPSGGPEAPAAVAVRVAIDPPLDPAALDEELDALELEIDLLRADPSLL